MDIVRTLHRTIDKRIERHLPQAPPLEVKLGRVADLTPSLHLSSVKLDGHSKPTPFIPYGALPVDLAVDDKVVVLQRRDGWQQIIAVLGRDREQEGLPNDEVFRASGGDDATVFREILGDVSPGTMIRMPDPLYLIASVDGLGYGINMTKHNIFLIGRGVPRQNDADPTADGGTVIRYVAPAPTTGTLMRWGARTSADDPVMGGGFENIALDGGYRAQTAFWVRKAEKPWFKNFWVGNATVDQIVIDSYERNPPGSVLGTKSIDFDRFSIWGYGTGACIRYDGDTTDAFHPYDIRMTRGKLNHGSGKGLLIKAGDDLWFDEMGLYGGTGWAIDITANGTPTYNGPTGIAFGKIFVLTSPNAVIVRSTGITKPPTQVTFWHLGTVDATQQVTIEPGASCRIVNDLGDSTLRPDLRSSVTITEDFVAGLLTDGNIGEHGWHLSGTGATVSYIASVANHPGIKRLDSGTTASTVACLSLGGAGAGASVLPAEGFDCLYVFRPVQADADVTYRIGLGNAYTANPPADGCWIEKLPGDTNWFACNSLAGAKSTRVDTGVVASAFGWVKLRMRRRNDTTIGYDIGNITNQQESIKISTQVPTVTLQPLFQVIPRITTAKQLEVDAFQLSIIGMDR